MKSSEIYLNSYLMNGESKSWNRTDEICRHVKFENNTSGRARLWDTALKFLCPGLFITSPDHLGDCPARSFLNGRWLLRFQISTACGGWGLKYCIKIRAYAILHQNHYYIDIRCIASTTSTKRTLTLTAQIRWRCPLHPDKVKTFYPPRNFRFRSTRFPVTSL